MSNQRIIHPTEDGGVTVIIPTSEYLEDHTIEEIAKKDVPTGVEYKIVDISEIPSDRTFRSAWEYQV
jgi:hypothetical protein